LEKLKNLTRLDLSDNQLTEAIPPGLGKLIKLTELDLSNNRLSGKIPGELGNLTELKILNLSKNQLKGLIPNNLINLEHIGDNQPDFRWNALDTHKKKWKYTQTTAPKKITAAALSRNTIKVGWNNIPYVSQNGGYQVHYREKSAGADTYKVKKWESKMDKRGCFVKITGLKPSTAYYFSVRSRTNPHSNNKNKIISDYSRKKQAVTQGTTISGYVETKAGTPVKEVTIEAANKGGRTTTNDKGHYQLNVEYGWTGTITLSKKGYGFSPLPPNTGKYHKVKKDLGNGHFEARAQSIISGNVKTPKDKGIGGVKLTFSDRENKKQESIITKKNGSYSHTVEPGWQGTVTLEKGWYPFEPADKKYDKPVYTALEQDYTAQILVFTVRITNLKKVEFSFKSPGRTGLKTFEIEKIDSPPGKNNVKYMIVVPYDWQGHVTPKKKGYIFYSKKPITVKKEMPGSYRYRAELDSKFFVSVTGHYRIPSEEKFDEVYGSGIFDPEIKAGYKFLRSFHVWTGYGLSSKNGASPVLKEPAKWKQQFISIGLGYNKNLSLHFAYQVELGIFYVSYREKALGEEVSGSALGLLRIGGAGIYKISNRLFTEISLAYLLASDTLNDINIKLGGLKAGIGLGLRF
jgi:hypothetical protein